MNHARSILAAMAVFAGAAGLAACGSSTGTAGTTGTGGTSASTGTTSAGGSAPTCDPFTGAPCLLPMGESCDFDLDGLPHCFPPPSGAKLCDPCGVDPGDGGVADYCGVGLTCLDSNKCAAFCCADGDCGGGTCDKSYLGDAKVGVCVAAASIPDGGAGDAGPLPFQPACGAPAVPPSKGSCFKP
jgi:hypothetical protein